MHYVFLALAIFTEVVGTLSLHFSEQFTRLFPSIFVVTAYAASFYFMSLSLKVIPIGIVYSVWSGVGIALIATIGHFVYGQKLDLAAMFGISLILIGVIIIQYFSQTTGH